MPEFYTEVLSVRLLFFFLNLRMGERKRKGFFNSNFKLEEVGCWGCVPVRVFFFF